MWWPVARCQAWDVPNSGACACSRCIGQSLVPIMHDAAVARLFAHFSFRLAPRMGGPAGVDAQVRCVTALNAPLTSTCP